MSQRVVVNPELLHWALYAPGHFTPGGVVATWACEGKIPNLACHN